MRACDAGDVRAERRVLHDGRLRHEHAIGVGACAIGKQAGHGDAIPPVPASNVPKASGGEAR